MRICNAKKISSNASAGFSLVELLVVTVMLSILVTAGYNLFTQQSKINRAQQYILEMQSSGRAALQVLVHHFSHAGFGSSDNIANFINHSNKGLNDDDSDTVILTYGYKRYGGTVDGNFTNTDTIAVSSSSSMANDANICFFPSFSPNKSYNIDNIDSLTQIKISPSIGNVVDGAKIYRVSPVTISVSNGILQQTTDVSAEETNIVYDVVEFHVAYTDKNKNDSISNWKDDMNAKDIKAAWIYILLKSRDRDPGYIEKKKFFLPWDNATLLDDDKIENGFHYQDFETKVWLRNVY